MHLRKVCYSNEYDDEYSETADVHSHSITIAAGFNQANLKETKTISMFFNGRIFI